MYNKKFNPMMLLVLISLLFTQQSLAKSATLINSEVDEAIKKFKKEVVGGEKFLPKVKGYLVFPSVIKGGFMLGGEAGNGVLLVKSEDGSWSPPAFYALGAASLGIQMGLQDTEIILVLRSNGAVSAILDSHHAASFAALFLASISFHCSRVIFILVPPVLVPASPC